ncbi:MAG: ester cyclase [Rhizobiaceae bacterium]|nr:ester cyclase [Rhizobiaceae bacterium]
MGRRNLDTMRAADLAWNERRWDDYAALIDDELMIFASGEEMPHHKAWHINRAKAFCIAFPDARLDMAPYLDLFMSHDGSKTCSVATFSGTMHGSLRRGNRLIAPNHRRFSITLMAICKWRNGKIVELREFFDTVLFARQLDIPPA